MDRMTYVKHPHSWNRGKYPTKYTSRHTFQEVVARLAAYEDTGLEPEEITALIAPQNVPLTLEEMLEMEGEQVWIDRPDGSEERSGWARVKLAAPWKPGGLKPHVFVVYPNGDRDYAGLLLECGDKIYHRKPEEESR